MRRGDNGRAGKCNLRRKELTSQGLFWNSSLAGKERRVLYALPSDVRLLTRGFLAHTSATVSGHLI
jgi:hypothetical protein